MHEHGALEISINELKKSPRALRNRGALKFANAFTTQRLEKYTHTHTHTNNFYPREAANSTTDSNRQSHRSGQSHWDSNPVNNCFRKCPQKAPRNAAVRPGQMTRVEKIYTSVPCPPGGAPFGAENTADFRVRLLRGGYGCRNRAVMIIVFKSVEPRMQMCAGVPCARARDIIRHG